MSDFLPAQWLSNSSDIGARTGAWFEAAAHFLSQPSRVLRLRQAVLVLLCLWLLLSLARLFWALFPGAEAPAAVDAAAVINPATPGERTGSRPPVDIEGLRGQHLFGDAIAATIVEEVPEPEAPAAAAREGIEKGAQETRLQLTLRGVVSANEEGLGHAIIEYKNQQEVYAVEDTLPVSGKVVLAKVMPRQVVLDNNGTYELLTLFDESDLDTQLEGKRDAAPAARPAPRPAPGRDDATVVDKRGDSQATELARGFREQLYRDPQSLGEVVRVTAVRRDGQLQGYRVVPGSDAGQFARLGFRPGDLVTSINGVPLDDPAGAMRLYQTMRTASEAVFEIERGGEPVSLSVSLGQSSE